jgi:nickel-type superoxide dismutase maturation protease
MARCDVARPRSPWRRLVPVAVTAYVVTWCVNRSLIDVRGGSMVPTLQDGDRVVTVPLPHRWLRPGQVVVVADPGDADHLVVKRVSRVDDRWVEVLGDAPGASTDSRHWGPLPVSSVRRVVVRRWPTSGRA